MGAFGRTTLLAIITLISCNLTFATHANASAWNREQGRILIITRADDFRSSSTLGLDDGQTIFQRRDVSTYVEYGLSRKFMIGGKVIYGTSNAVAPDTLPTNASGFSEVELFSQYQLWRRNSDVGGLRLGVIRPADETSGARQLVSGDGIDLDLSALYGRNLPFPIGTAFVSSEFGYRLRTGAGADQLRSNITFGANFTKNWLFLLDIQSSRALSEAELGSPDFDVVRLQPSLVWRTGKRFSLQAGGFSEVAGRNLARGRSFFISLWTEF